LPELNRVAAQFLKDHREQVTDKLEKMENIEHTLEEFTKYAIKQYHERLNDGGTPSSSFLVAREVGATSIGALPTVRVTEPTT
jgi:hypothetical protein